jgi:glycosyltransferase involved in cell wall biosynthesis
LHGRVTPNAQQDSAVLDTASPLGATVSVVIPARDASETLPAALAALAQQERLPEEVIVVDDGSSDATKEIARASPVVTAVLSQPGAGPGAARNRGAAAARGDVLAFTDADCIPEPGWLAAGVAALAAHDLVQGAVRPPDGAVIGPFDRTISVMRAHGLYETANMLVRRGVFESLGGFEPWLMPRDGKELGEDVWLGWRARRAGARIGFAADAVVHHAVFARRPREYIAERARLRHFPAMTRRIPELRDHVLTRRWFLAPRTLAFDLAATGLLAAALVRSPLPLAAVVPYARHLRRRAGGHGLRRGPVIVAVEIAADVVGAGALVAGSIENRTLVI